MEISNDLQEQVFILRILEEQIALFSEVAKDFSLPTTCINELIAFRQSVDENYTFQRENYLHLVDQFCKTLLPYIIHKEVIAFLLNFSKVSCEVSEIYLKNGLKFSISNFLSKHDFERNDYNEVLIQDFLFDYYYYIARDKVKSDGYAALLNFLQKLQHKEFCHTILHALKHSAYISREEFIRLQNSLKN